MSDKNQGLDTGGWWMIGILALVIFAFLTKGILW